MILIFLRSHDTALGQYYIIHTQYIILDTVRQRGFIKRMHQCRRGERGSEICLVWKMEASEEFTQIFKGDFCVDF